MSGLDVLDHEAAVMAHDLKTNVIVGLTIAGSTAPTAWRGGAGRSWSTPPNVLTVGHSGH
jgi:hypothetical protein